MPREGPPDAAAKPSPFTTTSLEHVLEVDPSTIEVTRKAEEGIVYKMVCVCMPTPSPPSTHSMHPHATPLDRRLIAA